MGLINNSSEITWMESKILNDPSLSARLYYTTYGNANDRTYREDEKLNNSDYLITVGTSTLSPSFSISHDWSNVTTSGLSSLFNSSLTYLSLFLSSLESNAANTLGPMSLLNEALRKLPWVGQFLPFMDGNYKSNIISNIITGNYNDLFKLYSGTRVNISTPDLTVYFLPSDDPSSGDLKFELCPLCKLKALLNWNPSKYKIDMGNGSSDTDLVVDNLLNLFTSAIGLVGVNALDLFKSGVKKVFGADKLDDPDKMSKFKLKVGGFIQKAETTYKNISKIVDKNNGALMGNTSYIKSLMVSSAPLKYRRGFNYDDDPRLQGTCLLKVNGVKYPNLLISDINVNYSLTKLINNNTDYGPSWIKVTFSFTPAIDYTLRDVSRMIGDKLESMNFKSIDLTVDGNSVLDTEIHRGGEVVATRVTTDYALDNYDKVGDEYIKVNNSDYLSLDEKLAKGTVSPTGSTIQGYQIINNVETNNSSLNSNVYSRTSDELGINDLDSNYDNFDGNYVNDTPGVSEVDNLLYTSREVIPIYLDKDNNEVSDPLKSHHTGSKIIYYDGNKELKTVTSNSPGSSFSTKYTELGASRAKFNKGN